ncbi:uncharacterized protein LOC129596703 [Paramacrobiotus metropolitanus]|uniref:uncharacterized protein LOC129596703 n=1 Tax=Paramacrobiotus metropolitanus TaxID=2943436 RepID=UPI002445688A|nr:uncharacterized protein LOC129596703 [Paramacrobiotus metropolitanus]
MSQSFPEPPNRNNRGEATKVAKCLRQVLDCGGMSDVQFAVGRQYGAVRIFPAHRVIMVARSDVFHTMFYGSLPENCANPVSIPDILPDAFANMLSYIYADTVANLTEDNVFETLNCADKNALPSLVRKCTRFILNKLNRDTCQEILDKAVSYKYTPPIVEDADYNIMEMCLRLIDASAEGVWQSDQFTAIGQEALQIILPRESLAADEVTIYSSVEKLLLPSELLDIFRYKHADVKSELPFRTEARKNESRTEGLINFTVPDVRKLEEGETLSDPVVIRKMPWKISDVQFAVGRDYGIAKIFPAHRLVLSVRSVVFETMFYGSLPDKCTGPIDIPDILPDAFANMLSFLYTDKVTNFTQDNVFDTLKCADKYDLPLLVTMCTDFVLDTIDVHNCLDSLDSALHFGEAAPSILEKCLCLIDESVIIWRSEKFRTIGEKALRAILQRDTLTANEHSICSSVNEWSANMCAQRNMDATPANRREVLGQALYLIRFPLMTEAQLLDGPVKSGLLLQSEALDIYLHKHATTKPELLFRTDPRQNVRAEGVIHYTIPDLRELRDQHATSDFITVRKLLWGIGVAQKMHGALGFYLLCTGYYARLDSWTCHVNAELRLLPWKTETEPITKPLSRLFDKKSLAWGYRKFISMEELLDPDNGYVNPSDFSLRLEIKVTADLPTGIE